MNGGGGVIIDSKLSYCATPRPNKLIETEWQSSKQFASKSQTFKIHYFLHIFLTIRECFIKIYTTISHDNSDVAL